MTIAHIREQNNMSPDPYVGRLLREIDQLKADVEAQERQIRRQGDKLDAAWKFLDRVEYGWCRPEDRDADIAELKAALRRTTEAHPDAPR